MYTIHISTSNSKLGKMLSFSTTPVKGCGKNCHVCAGKCYAMKAYRMYPSCKVAWDDNFMAVLTETGREDIRLAVGAAVQRHKARVFRWFVAGDIYSHEMFTTMIDTANDSPSCQFYAFTKCYDIVNAWIDNNGDLPDNLHVIFSKWDGLEMDNPHGLPVSDVIMPGDDEKALTPGAYICPNQLDKAVKCAKCPRPCWMMTNGQTVLFLLH